MERKMIGSARLRRLLLVTHRWLGLALCLVMLAWFSSGMLMLFVPYPGLELEPAAPLPPAAVAGLTLPALATAASELTLRMHQGQPRWFGVDDAGHRTLA